MQINQRRFKGHFVSHLSNVVDELNGKFNSRTAYSYYMYVVHVIFRQTH